MAEGVRRALRDCAAKTPRGGLQVNLYPNTYYGFAIRGDRRNQDERDRRASHATALRLGLKYCWSTIAGPLLLYSSACLCHHAGHLRSFPWRLRLPA